jgi:hypothetical protein
MDSFPIQKEVCYLHIDSVDIDIVVGWSPLTGVGSPNFAQIRKFVAQLP